MKLKFLIVAFLACCGSAWAQSSSLLTNVGGRQTVSLNGSWKAIVDPYDFGASKRGFFLDAKPASKSEFIEYSFDASEALNVPGDWNTQREKLFFYEGSVWYKKSFDYQAKANTRLFVYFGAANYQAEAYLNGKQIGRHTGGFTPFNFEITDAVREKENFLVVRVDSRRSRDAVPELMTDWWNYGGLTRDVKLIETPETFLQDYFIQLRPGAKDEIAGWVKLNGKALAQTVNINIPEAGIRQAVTTDANGYAEFKFKAALKLWSPESPKLYDVALATAGETIQDRIGFRAIEVKGPDILLNGKPLFLRGVCIHEEAPLRGGRGSNAEDARTLLGWVKEMGGNFVRLAHYPHSEEMTREADKIGLLVWSEIPVYWNIQWENPATYANAQNQLDEMITRDRNRAAVILWSVSNETQVSDARTRFLRSLIDRARSLDPTRLLTAAMLHHYANETTQMIDDPLGQYLDVLGCNEYIGWYDGQPVKADRMEWQTPYQKPVIMSEFGAEALAGNHGEEAARWTEENQESFYRHQLGMLKKIPFLRGTAPWILMDFRSPRRLLPGVQDYYNRKGLVSPRGEKKKAFYVMQEFYRSLAK